MNIGHKNKTSCVDRKENWKEKGTHHARENWSNAMWWNVLFKTPLYVAMTILQHCSHVEVCLVLQSHLHRPAGLNSTLHISCMCMLGKRSSSDAILLQEKKIHNVSVLKLVCLCFPKETDRRLNQTWSNIYRRRLSSILHSVAVFISFSLDSFDSTSKHLSAWLLAAAFSATSVHHQDSIQTPIAWEFLSIVRSWCQKLKQ